MYPEGPEAGKWIPVKSTGDRKPEKAKVLILHSRACQ